MSPSRQLSQLWILSGSFFDLPKEVSDCPENSASNSPPNVASKLTFATFSLITFTLGFRDIPTNMVADAFSSVFTFGAEVRFLTPSSDDTEKPTLPSKDTLNSIFPLASITKDGVISIYTPKTGENPRVTSGISTASTLPESPRFPVKE